MKRPDDTLRAFGSAGSAVGSLLAMLFVSGMVAGGAHEANAPGNLSYSGILQGEIQLDDGRYEGDPFVPGGLSRTRVVLAEKPVARGDLDGDGRDEIAVLLLENSGGSGERVFLSVLADRDGALRNVATKLLGDRVRIRAMVFGDGVLALDMVVAGAGDAACCPTLKVRDIYRFKRGELARESREELGVVSLRDLDGTAWVLTHLDRDDPLPEGTAATLVFAEGKVHGRGGCNRYFGGVQDRGQRGLNIGPLGATRKLCPEAEMAVEVRFLTALQNVERFDFFYGDLALTYRDGKRRRTLILRPASG